MLSILAEAHDFESYLQKLEVARMILANYEERLASGDVEIRDLVVSKRITREPRDYQKAGVTAIAAQQLFGSGVRLRPGQNIEYIKPLRHLSRHRSRPNTGHRWLPGALRVWKVLSIQWLG